MAILLGVSLFVFFLSLSLY